MEKCGEKLEKKVKNFRTQNKIKANLRKKIFTSARNYFDEKHNKNHKHFFAYKRVLWSFFSGKFEEKRKILQNSAMSVG